jgi:hypothetical protein
MSNINDALKRAQQAQQQNPTPPDGKMPKPLPAPSEPDKVIGWLLPGVVGLLLVAACLFIGLALLTRTATKLAAKPKPPAAQPTALASASQSVSTPTLVPAKPGAPSPPPAPLGPKLQGIIYAASGPQAIIDGQTLRVGDRVGSYQVKAISRASVTLEAADGSRKILDLAK